MNEKEFMDAYDAHADALFRHCFFRLGDRERSKDLVQDAFLRTWEYSARGAVIANPRAWLYKILHNLIVDEFRKKKPVSLEELKDKGIDIVYPEKMSAENRAETANIFALFGKLETKYRAAAVMRYIDDLTPKEIADITGETEGNIAIRINRANAKLRLLMKIS